MKSGTNQQVLEEIMDVSLLLFVSILFGGTLCCICHLVSSGCHVIKIRGRFGPASAEFVARRKIKKSRDESTGPQDKTDKCLDGVKNIEKEKEEEGPAD